jgi:hypothetical protein
MIVSKIKSFIKKQINPQNTIDPMDLIICHLNSSRCSKKDILSELVFTVKSTFFNLTLFNAKKQKISLKIFLKAKRLS